MYPAEERQIVAPTRLNGATVLIVFYNLFYLTLHQDVADRHACVVSLKHDQQLTCPKSHTSYSDFCRSRHQKCDFLAAHHYEVRANTRAGDQKRPDCGRCGRAKRRCTYDTHHISKRYAISEQRDFDSHQVWVPIPSKRSHEICNSAV
jgi:hypothetical protein